MREDVRPWDRGREGSGSQKGTREENGVQTLGSGNLNSMRERLKWKVFVAWGQLLSYSLPQSLSLLNGFIVSLCCAVVRLEDAGQAHL